MCVNVCVCVYVRACACICVYIKLSILSFYFLVFLDNMHGIPAEHDCRLCTSHTFAITVFVPITQQFYGRKMFFLSTLEKMY